jgi:hypothetical protein
MARFIAAVLVFTVTAASSLYPAPIQLKVEGLLEPVLALSEQLPRFAFTHVAPTNSRRGLAQTGYRITVAKLGPNSGTVWDSGRTASSNCSEIVYAGSDLDPFAQYKWTVIWFGSDGGESAASTAVFEMGPITAADWGAATYLTGSQLRYEFSTPAKATRGRAYVAAAGCSVLEVNGKRPAPDLLGVCAWTVFTKRILYQTHDITNLLSNSSGRNAIGLLSGKVMSAEAGTPTLLRGLIRLEFEGGHPAMLIHTGVGQWWETDSFVTNVPKVRWATTMNWPREQQGWSSPSFFPPQYVATMVGDSNKIAAQGTVDGKAQTEVVCSAGAETSGNLTLKCSGGGKFSTIDFASFGLPILGPNCSRWAVNASCSSNKSVAVVAAACLQQQHCTLPISFKAFGDPCSFEVKTLAVRATW